MEFLDPVILSRMQFAANITFHILFPTISIALCWFLLFMRWRWMRTQDPAWLSAYGFWVKVFALTFALGVVSGIVMSFQFGTNWPGFMQRAGNIAGPLLGYEVLTAFFLEATFLGVMLFGHHRVSPRVHLFATAMVAFGTTMSAFWILSLNSWMQTPTGYRIENGVFFVENWLEVIFNPSFPYRLSHKLIASGLTTAFLVVGVSAWQVLRQRQKAYTARTLKLGLIAASVLIPVQIFVGDLHGLNTLEHQPQKIAAIEGVWHTEQGAPLMLFGFPDESTRTTHLGIGIPKLASLILTHELDGTLRGLNEFPNAHPPVAPLFWGFRIMVGVGMLMLLVAWYGLWRLYRAGGVAERMPTGLLRVFVGMTFSGWVATVAGWYVTEIGRQPFVVHGLLRTADVVTTEVPAGHIALTLVTYCTVYIALIIAFVSVLRYMAEKPDSIDETSQPMPAAPLLRPGVSRIGG